MSLKRILIAVPVVAVTAVSSLIVALWAEHARSSELPLPSGQFAVGRTMLHLIDSTSRDSLSPGISAPREWSVWVWYPASENGPTGDEYLVAVDQGEAEEDARSDGAEESLGPLTV